MYLLPSFNIYYVIIAVLTADYVEQVNSETKASGIIVSWNNTFKERQAVLKHITSTSVYLNFFKQLFSDIGKILVSK